MNWHAFIRPMDAEQAMPTDAVELALSV